MYRQALDSIAENLKVRVADPSDFVEKYGARAAILIEELPALFRLFRRLPFDRDVDPAARRLSALIAFYIADQQDFIAEGEGTSSVGLVDDAYAAFVGLRHLTELVGEEALEAHWRPAGDHALADLVALSHSLDLIRDKMPPKAVQSVDWFLSDEAPSD